MESLKIKARYIVDNELAGAMFWSLSLDDFNGTFCNQGKSPLINTVRNEISEYFKIRINKILEKPNTYPPRTVEKKITRSLPSSTTKTFTTEVKIEKTKEIETKSKQTFVELNKESLENSNHYGPRTVSKVKNSSDENFQCIKDGLFADVSSDCRAFFQCFRSNTEYEIKARFFCPEGTLFNQRFQVCDWKAGVQCL